MPRPIIGHTKSELVVQNCIYGLVKQANDSQHTVSVVVLEAVPDIPKSLESLLAGTNSRYGRDFVLHQNGKAFIFWDCDEAYAAKLLTGLQEKLPSDEMVAAYVQEYEPRPPEPEEPIKDVLTMMQRMRKMLSDKQRHPLPPRDPPVWKADAREFYRDVLAGYEQVSARKGIYFKKE